MMFNNKVIKKINNKKLKINKINNKQKINYKYKMIKMRINLNKMSKMI